LSQSEDSISIFSAATTGALDNLCAATGNGLSVDRGESCWLIRLEGDVGVTLAAELQTLLIEGIASGKELWLNLERAGRIDITVLQLVWAAARERGNGPGIVQRLSDQADGIARDAGFPAFPGCQAAE